ncbi:uncharacterized protein LOC114730436 [Neltuma alba]|uniref:uncharacterized protein LOC114730436 n=1 Tax=Neltuma alba TaxID=207710 RepID=UPI0010A3EF17|nr:uncharacterized protein LOC114730436 [Prosopis alba]
MVFVKSVDGSDLVQDAKTLFTLFCEVIEWIGSKNIVHVMTDNVHVMTDNAANYVVIEWIGSKNIVHVVTDNAAYDFKTNLLSDWRKELYSTHGMVFVKSVDASDLVQDAKTLFTLFCEVIEWIGSKNIVHVVTDNAANYVACGRLIKEKYKSIYWSPCAAHCLNLVLKDFSSMPHVSDLASKASKITVFAYNHMVFLSWLRKRPTWKEIVRLGATRFATTFITLHSIYMHKNDLQALVVDKHYVDHKLSRTEAGKNFSAIILDNRFWNDCYQVVKIVSPLIKLLRIVDSDEKPSLPYVYKGMRRAKMEIKEMFKKNKDMYKPHTTIIQTRWDKHLNPAITYAPDCPIKSKLMMALIDVVESYSDEEVDGFLVMKQATTYREAKESFTRPSCQKAAQKLDPLPELQRVAMRILS